jgi:hypothetical protein
MAKDQNLDGVGARAPKGDLGTPRGAGATVDTARTANAKKAPTATDTDVDTATAGPNDSGVTNTRGLRQYEADRYKPRG